MKVKICGVTRPEDARLAAELGAGMIGMIFWPSSPRVVDRDRARAIVAALPPGTQAVGVFVNQTDEAASIAADVGLAAVQLHGDERPADYADFPVPVIKAIGAATQDMPRAIAEVPAHVMVLLDAHDPVRRGGTGSVIDWTAAAAVARARPVLLAGGLAPHNVAAAIAAVRPYGIDVSSGVEAAPREKDEQKLRALFGAIAAGGAAGTGTEG